MTVDLVALIKAEMATAAPDSVVALAKVLSDPERDAAILYYGSTLRTHDLTGILDFYRLTKVPHRRGLRGAIERVLWPEVSYHEVRVDDAVLRAKVATLPLAQFHRAAQGQTLDTTIWARFVQPCQLVWCADVVAGRQAVQACTAAVVTASRFAARLGPVSGPAEAYWMSLFQKTYAAEFRVESTDRAGSLLETARSRYTALLTMAWHAGGVSYEDDRGILRPIKQGLPSWRLPSLAGKPLNIARLTKAAFTFEGAARYAAWKVQRHTGIEIPVTPFAERYPLLAAPGAWWRLRRRQAEARRGR